MIKIGDTFVSNKKIKVTVIKIENHKKISVKFEDSGHEDVYQSQTLLKGTFTDKSLLPSYQVTEGKLFKTKKSGIVEVLKVFEDNSVLVKFKNSGNEKKFKSKASIFKGSATDDIDIVGKIFESNNSGNFIVLEYIRTDNVIIKFLNTDYITTTTLQNIRKGQVKCPPIQVGMKFQTTACGEISIIEYINSKKVLVRFENTNFEKYTDSKSIKLGSVFDNKTDIQTRGYRKSETGYLYIHKYTNEWYKIGITNNYEQRFKKLESNILKPESFLCFYSNDGSIIKSIEYEILCKVPLVKYTLPNEVERLVKIGKSEIFFESDLNMVLEIIKKYNVDRINVKDGKICKES